MGDFTDLAKLLYGYFNSFLPSYLENSVPENTSFPYATYTLSYDADFEENLIQFRVFTQSSSMTQVAEFCDRVSKDIGSGKVIDNKLWIYKGSPFQQFTPEDDIKIKSVYMNIIIRYLV